MHTPTNRKSTGVFRRFPFHRQLDSMDCGPACLRMIAAWYGKYYPLPYLREKCYIDREGVSLKGISEAAESIGFRAMAVKVDFGESRDAPCLLGATFPVIAHWNQNHFVVVVKANHRWVWIADPGAGQFRLTRREFEQSWCNDGARGILLLLEPGREFYREEGEPRRAGGLSFLLPYLLPHRRLMIQLALGLAAGSVFSLIFPFLTQAIVDVGIQNQNIGFIYLMLAGQLAFFAGQTAVSFIQNWILLHIGVRMNIGLISDFLIKLMRLPLGFFDAKMTGDLLQRIGDHRRIEAFLTQSTLSVLFSVINLVVFAVVLLVYSGPIFFIFLGSSILYIAWILFFLKKRKEIDYRSFQQLSRNQDALIEIIQGMPEIRLQGSQQKRRRRWMDIQAKLFRVQMSGLALSQYQDAGGLSINQVKNILITVVAARAVVEGQMTLGMMLAVQYIIGQLNGPLQQFISFIRSAQDAAISLERLGEIHGQENEEPPEAHLADRIPPGDIRLENLSFRYTPISDWVLRDLDLVIPRGKVTAIVGMSGSGKTTLVKLLLGFYPPEKGSIKIGPTDLRQIRPQSWRAGCGVVLQDGYIFSDTIANNIAESDEFPHFERIDHAVSVANIRDFIDALPLGYNTMIGARGNGLSQGQRQRLLIARAVYKDPEFLFFDEATNALDANNERVILENLNRYFEGRTVIVVAHRLSTVKNADQIVVMDQGKIMEVGAHLELVRQRGRYYTLVKNQLELGA